MDRHYNPLLYNVVLFDTETTGLARDHGMYEMALFDPRTKQVLEWTVDPNLIGLESSTAQDRTKLASGPADRIYYRQKKGWDWPDAIYAQTLTQTQSSFAKKNLPEVLKRHDRFLLRAMKRGAPHLRGEVESPLERQSREALLKRYSGAELVRSNKTKIQEILAKGGELEEAIRGKTVWIANTNFESSMVGAHLAAMEEEGLEPGIKRFLETQNPNSPNPFYVTGREVNIARIEAQQTGDWTGVWEAYKAYTPKKGETAVRDIQDVTRAMYSYGRKLGIFSSQDNYFGHSIDVTSRLFGGLGPKGREWVGFAELHRAAEDAAIHEWNVLKSSVHYTTVLEEVYKGTEYGKQLLEEARSGYGAFYEATRFFENLEELAPTLKRASLAQRLERAWSDIERDGQTHQFDGWKKVITSEQLTPDGGTVEVSRQLPHRTGFSSMDQVVDFLKSHAKYEEFGVSIDEEYEQFRKVASQGQEAVTDWVEARGEKVQQWFRENRNEVVVRTPSPEKLTSAELHFSRATKSINVGALLDTMPRHSGKGLMAAGALGMAALGFVYQGRGGGMNYREETHNLTSYSYQEWLAHQEDYFGMEPYGQAMQENGILAGSRKALTDFGSPYRGPVTSSLVFHDQELLREREKYLQRLFGAQHFDPDYGVLSLLNPIKKLPLRGGYRYIQDRSAYKVEDGEYGLQGRNLVGLDLSRGKWKIEAEDADTVSVQRAGMVGAMRSFFGMNQSYSFRLAGIDSPETDHGDRSYHGAQPRADRSTEVLQSMLARSEDLKLVFDPTQTTYGRMMGAVVGDGRNLNYELVRRGAAAHLPYGNPRDSMIDYSALARLEEHSAGANRGIWQTPWAQAYRDISEQAGNRITFNTLASASSIAESGARMGMIGLMEQAQEQGGYSTMQQIEGAQIASAMRAQEFKADYQDPIMFQARTRPHNVYVSELATDLNRFIRTKGTGNVQNKHSRKGGYGQLDKHMVLDSIGSSTSTLNRRKLKAYDMYGSSHELRLRRKIQMQQRQQQINQTMFNSGIGHHQM